MRVDPVIHLLDGRHHVLLQPGQHVGDDLALALASIGRSGSQCPLPG
jgi:hypothetical protein